MQKEEAKPEAAPLFKASVLLSAVIVLSLLLAFVVRNGFSWERQVKGLGFLLMTDVYDANVKRGEKMRLGEKGIGYVETKERELFFAGAPLSELKTVWDEYYREDRKEEFLKRIGYVPVLSRQEAVWDEYFYWKAQVERQKRIRRLDEEGAGDE